MSTSSFNRSPLWSLSLISRVTVPVFTRLCSLRIARIISLRTSASGVLTRLSFPPPPIYLLMSWRVVSLSVKYSKFSWTWCVCRHSRRSTSSGRFDLSPSSSWPPCVSVVPSVLCEEGGPFPCKSSQWREITEYITHWMWVNVTWGFSRCVDSVELKESPESVPSQYVFSGPWCRCRCHSSVVVLSVRLLWCLASFGASVGDFTQHSYVDLCFVTRTLMSPLRHNPLIFKSLLFSFSSLFRQKSWWKVSLFPLCWFYYPLVKHSVVITWIISWQ